MVAAQPRRSFYAPCGRERKQGAHVKAGTFLSVDNESLLVPGREGGSLNCLAAVV